MKNLFLFLFNKMAKFTICLMFERNRKEEPSAILRCDTSAEFYPYDFYCWKDAVHFWGFYQNECKQSSFVTTVSEVQRKWEKKYGYDNYEEFRGNLNEFNHFNEFGISVDQFEIEPGTDLYKTSAWTLKEKIYDDDSS